MLLSFYYWIRQHFGADAVVHVGKHGNLGGWVKVSLCRATVIQLRLVLCPICTVCIVTLARGLKLTSRSV